METWKIPNRETVTSHPVNPVGDLVRAVAILHPSDTGTLKDILNVLGIDQQQWGSNKELLKSQAPSTDIQKKTDKPKEHFLEQTSQSDILKEVVPSRLRRLPPLHGSMPEWVHDVPEVAQSSGMVVYPTQIEPLLRPIWTRSIISTAASTISDEGEPHIEAIVNAIARGESLYRLPSYSRPTLARGLQVLIDIWEGMEPFARDQNVLVPTLVSVVGSDRTEVLKCAGSPLWGVTARAESEWMPYRPPNPGTPVLAVTDLGIGRLPMAERRASPRDWADFASYLRRAGCPFVTLVPYPPHRWPRSLSTLRIIQWDRQTTPSMVKNTERYAPRAI